MKNAATFYYDETFHDRRLNTKNGVLNAYLESSNDGFVYAILGLKDDKIQDFLNDYVELEKVTKTNLNIDGELKSTTFNNKNLRHGIASLKRDTKDFYFRFFDLLIKCQTLFQVGFISKTEILVHRFLRHVSLPAFVPYKSFVYSFTKVLETHRLEYLFTHLLCEKKNNIKIFASKTIEMLEVLLENIKGIKREEVEISVVRNIISILKNSEYDDSGVIDEKWNYLIIADGVKKRIGETELGCKVIIDNEQSTCDAFNELQINCEQQDSKKCAGIRAVDMFVGFVGRIIKSLKSDRKEPPLQNLNQIRRELYLKKRLISNSWFEIDEKAFLLYKKIGEYFSSATYWSSFTLCYGDDLMMFFSLFNYINTYITYDSYLENSSMHSEYYNTYVCSQIGNLYSEEGR